MKITRISNVVWRLEKEDKMNVPGYIFATENMMDAIRNGKTLEQLKNVASLPGIVKHALAMPDAHQGYGFPIGGVAAFDAEDGIISPGGVGYDINCGVRLLTTTLTKNEVQPKIQEIADKLFQNVPSGVGSEGKLRLSHEELDEVAVQGIDWAIEHGFGRKEDKKHTEEYGRISGADPRAVSPRAKKRGKRQLGTLGAGNHFLEIQYVENVYDEKTAGAFGLEKDQVVVMIHTGSRGYGHQICSDNIPPLLELARRNNLYLPDPELAYAPMGSPEAESYLKGMKCGVNFAFTNRHIIMHWVRETFGQIFGSNVSDEMNLVYDVTHNIAKEEMHTVEGEKRKLIVHRKGATRAFPAGRPELPQSYRSIGQPVLIPGSMGTASYVLVGNPKGLEVSWGSTCHGAGRSMSRSNAIRKFNGDEIKSELLNKGIYVRATKPRIISEEAPGAYKDVDDVVKSVSEAGISNPVTRLKPMGVVKG